MVAPPLGFTPIHIPNRRKLRSLVCGTTLLRTPIRAPRAIVICERLIGNLCRECPDHILLIGVASDLFPDVLKSEGVNCR